MPIQIQHKETHNSNPNLELIYTETYTNRRELLPISPNPNQPREKGSDLRRIWRRGSTIFLWNQGPTPIFVGETGIFSRKLRPIFPEKNEPNLLQGFFKPLLLFKFPRWIETETISDSCSIKFLLEIGVDSFSEMKSFNFRETDTKLVFKEEILFYFTFILFFNLSC